MPCNLSAYTNISQKHTASIFSGEMWSVGNGLCRIREWSDQGDWSIRDTGRRGETVNLF
jgi:hypothetical protein